MWRVFMRKMTGKRKLYSKLLVIASLFAVIPVFFLGGLSYILSDHSLRQEISMANKETIIQIQQRVDEKLKTVDKTILNHAINIKPENYSYRENSYDYVMKHDQITAVIRSILLLTEDVDSVYLYIKGSNPVLYSAYGLENINVISPHIFPVLDLGEKPFYWIDHRKDNSLSREATHIVTLVRKIPNHSGGIEGYFIININDRAFFRIFKNLSIGKSGELLILTPEGNIFSDRNKSLLQRNFHDYDFIKEIADNTANEKITTTQVDGTRMMINYVKSDYTGWKYITVIKVQDLMKHVQWIKQVTIIICMVLIGISIFTAMLLSKKFYRVIEKIVNIIDSKKVDEEVQPQMDELGRIYYHLRTLNTINDTLEVQVKETKSLLYIDFIKRMLLKKVEQDEYENYRDYLDSGFDTGFFLVMCVKMEFSEKHGDRGVILPAAVNVVKEIVGHYTSRAMVLEVSLSKIAVLINYLHKEDTVSSDMVKIGEDIADAMESILCLPVVVGVGGCCEGLQNTHTSYEEALDTINHWTQGMGRVVDISKLGASLTSFVYPARIEHRILISMKIGNLEAVHKLLDEFYNAISENGLKKHFYSVQVFHQLASSSLKEFYELDPEVGPTLFEYNLYEQLSKFETHNEIMKWLKLDFYPSIVNHVIQCRNKRDFKSIDKVVEYIHTHYDSELSQPILGEMISMPPAVFSKAFKGKIGLNLNEYIISIRMEKAKEMLITTNMRVVDIGARLQYNNSQNFIRVFKQVTGMTPGEYRDKGKDSSSEKI